MIANTDSCVLLPGIDGGMVLYTGLKLPGCLLDGLFNIGTSAAAANIATHRPVDISIAGFAIGDQQGPGRH